MDEIKIKVSTENLQSKASAVDGLIGKMNRQYDELYRKVKSISAYWKGEAAVKSMERCEKDKELVASMLQRLKKYPEDLQKMAGIYDTGNKAVEDGASSLPFDVIL